MLVLCVEEAVTMLWAVDPGEDKMEVDEGAEEDNNSDEDLGSLNCTQHIYTVRGHH